MRALITGGAGFIGSHLAEALVLQGHHVTVLDDLSTGRLENIAHLAAAPGFRCVIDTVTSESAVMPLVERADAVFHLAAAVGPRLVVERPIHTIHTNVNGTETVLKAACRFDKRVLVASTSEVYGKGHDLPFREDADLVLGPPDKVRWGYATSKLLDEFLALAYAREHGLHVIVVRLFNTVGPRQSARSGMVLPNFVRWALAGEPIVVHGDGSQTRSFTWVGDVVWAISALMDEPRAAGQVFNIGNGHETPIRSLAQRVCELTGSPSKLVFTSYEQAFDRNFDDMPRRVPDIGKLRRLIAYEPRVQLDGMIESVMKYWNAANGLRPKVEGRRVLPSVVVPALARL